MNLSPNCANRIHYSQIVAIFSSFFPLSFIKAVYKFVLWFSLPVDFLICMRTTCIQITKQCLKYPTERLSFPLITLIYFNFKLSYKVGISVSSLYRQKKLKHREIKKPAQVTLLISGTSWTWTHVVSNHQAMLPQEPCVCLVGFIMISSHSSLSRVQRWDSCQFLPQKKSRFMSAGVIKIWKQYPHDCGTKICPMLEVSQMHPRKTDSIIENFFKKKSRWMENLEILVDVL